MIRFITCILFIVVFLIWSIPMFLVELIIGLFSRKARDYSSLRIVQWGFKVVRFIGGIKTTVIGYDKIPKNEPVLFVGNHRSIFDVVIAYSMMPNLTGFVSKKEMEKVPLLSIWMRFIYCLFLDRKDIKKGMKTVLVGIDYIKSGVSIVVFPEGTRNTQDSGLLPFKAGSLKFAEKTGCKIVPMVQNNTEMCFENQFPRVRKTHTVLEFCDPIDLDTLSKEDKKFLSVYVQKIIEEKYEENKKLV